MKRTEEECTRNLALKEQKRKELYAKQGRGSQFSSKVRYSSYSIQCFFYYIFAVALTIDSLFIRQDARDEWIKNELKQLTKQIKDKQEHHAKIKEDLKRDHEKQIALEKKIAEHTAETERQRASIDEHNKQYYEMNKAKDQCQATRKEQ